VKNSSAIYRAITKITAILLLMAFLIPTGLQAKDLVEFCMMEMSSHQTTQTTTSDLNHHCDTEPAEEKKTTKSIQAATGDLSVPVILGKVSSVIKIGFPLIKMLK